MKARFIVILLFCSGLFQYNFAQDIHFSNFYTNTLNLNPANAGFFTGSYRFCIAYRDQYRTVAEPYQTLSANFDAKISNRHMQTALGYGLLFNYDMAGDADYTTVQFGIPLAQHIPINGNSLIFSYGLLPAIHYCSLDYSSLTFLEQFEGDRFNPQSEISEDIDMNSRLYFDFSLGTQFLFKPNKQQSYTVGFAFYNLNRPNVSFYKEDGVKLKTRTVICGTANISVTQNIDIVPGIKMQFQGKQHEFHLGGMGIFYLDNPLFSQIQTGLWFRSKNKDAIIFGLGTRYKEFDIMLDYDLNISTLRTASNGHGAFELTISYIFDKANRSKRMTAVRCPHSL